MQSWTPDHGVMQPPYKQALCREGLEYEGRNQEWTSGEERNTSSGNSQSNLQESSSEESGWLSGLGGLT